MTKFWKDKVHFGTKFPTSILLTAEHETHLDSVAAYVMLLAISYAISNKMEGNMPFALTAFMTLILLLTGYGSTSANVMQDEQVSQGSDAHNSPDDARESDDEDDENEEEEEEEEEDKNNTKQQNSSSQSSN